MIISDKYKIIFIHIPKNAGTYVSKVLYNLDNNIKRYSINGTGHLYPKECIKLIGADKFNKYRKFCVVRNIYDKIYSLYNYIRDEKRHGAHEMVSKMSFIEYIHFIKNNIKTQERIISHLPYIVNDNNNTVIDKMLKFEHLETDLIDFFNEMGVDIKGCLIDKKINPSVHDHYSGAYTNEIIELLKDVVQDDVNFFAFEKPSFK